MSEYERWLAQKLDDPDLTAELEACLLYTSYGHRIGAALPKESIANAFRVEIRPYSVRQTCYNGCKWLSLATQVPYQREGPLGSWTYARRAYAIQEHGKLEGKEDIQYVGNHTGKAGCGQGGHLHLDL